MCRYITFKYFNIFCTILYVKNCHRYLYQNFSQKFTNASYTLLKRCFRIRPWFEVMTVIIRVFRNKELALLAFLCFNLVNIFHKFYDINKQTWNICLNYQESKYWLNNMTKLTNTCMSCHVEIILVLENFNEVKVSIWNLASEIVNILIPMKLNLDFNLWMYRSKHSHTDFWYLFQLLHTRFTILRW